jgi:myo-inositol-1(or 4)-monophosphatase
MEPGMQPGLSDLESLAREAGDILRTGIKQSKTIQYKGTIDLVTEFDHRSEAYLLSEIHRRFPDHRVVSEESGGLDGGPCCVWYVDPLDGTVNFAHGIPIFSVSIAYAENGQVKTGVVYDPIQDECFSAELGSGAWLNGQPIHVAQAVDLDHSLLVTGFRYDIRTNPQNNLAEYARFALLSQGVRRLGSAALDLSYVAAGRFDGYWELHIQPWDVAAGALIAREAGAKVTNTHGEADFLVPPCTILAANPEIHSLMLDVLENSER